MVICRNVEHSVENIDQMSLADNLRDGVGYMIAVFLFFPGVIFVLGVMSGVSFSLIVSLETLYYLAAIFLVVARALGVLDRLVSR
jgi:hypothetical protein